MLTRDEKKAYHDIYEALSCTASSFQTARIDPKSFAKAYMFVRFDHPEIFYSARYSFRYYEHADSMEVIPEYMFKPSKLKTHIQAVSARVKKVAASCMDKDEFETEKNIHDFILGNVTYDKLKKDYSHEIIGPLTTGVGVCEGIAKTFKILCDRLGIWCIVALSENNPDKGIRYRHAWNIVRLGKNYYHIDATFDNTLSREGTARYDYFNLPDSSVFRDHENPVYPLPPCSDGKNSYYIRKKLAFTKEEDLRKRALQYAKKEKVLVFLWRGGYLSGERIKEICAVIDEAAAEKEKQARVFVNHAQSVFMAMFDRNVPEQNLIYENANEGEEYEGGN